MVVFQAIQKHLWNPGAVGERARRAMCLCLQLPNISKRVDTENIPSKATNSSEDVLQTNEQRADTTTSEYAIEQPEKEDNENETNATANTPSYPGNIEAPTPPRPARAPLVMINYEKFVHQQVFITCKSTHHYKNVMLSLAAYPLFLSISTCPCTHSFSISSTLFPRILILNP